MSNWKEFIYNTDFSKPNLAEIQAQLNQAAQGCNVYPPQEQIFSAFDKTPLDQVRVVILGQDPYHEANQANGLAFSVNAGTKMPPSCEIFSKKSKLTWVENCEQTQICLTGQSRAYYCSIPL